MTPPCLLRLMWRPNLSPNVRLGPEDRICIEIADRCREWTLTGRLSAVWHHPANEGRRNRLEGMRLKAIGLIPGTPDFVFTGPRSLVMEIKSETGRMQDTQKMFREWCESVNVPYALVRSANQAEEVLRHEGLLI